MDDASRYVVALEAHHTEREVDMLGLFVRALRRHGKPDALFLDNGSTYRGDTLATACARLGITLVHARPYDPQARGKMERFWIAQTGSNAPDGFNLQPGGSSLGVSIVRHDR